MKLKDLRYNFHAELDPMYGTDEVESFFYILTEFHLNVTRIQLASNPDLTIDAAMKIKFDGALQELKKERPIQYIVGETYFRGLRILTNENVLIPRPETEELVDWICEYIKGNAQKQLHILDIGTGSGCIAIAIAKEFPSANTYAIDISKKALELAKVSAELNEVNIQFIEDDILTHLQSTFSIDLKFDIIVSNPPYVRVQEKEQMQPNVLNNEPHIALFVEDDDPLVFYRSIIQFADRKLSKNGLLFFEINEYLGNEMSSLIKGSTFDHIEIRKDVFGKDRMVKISR